MRRDEDFSENRGDGRCRRRWEENEGEGEGEEGTREETTIIEKLKRVLTRNFYRILVDHLLQAGVEKTKEKVKKKPSENEVKRETEFQKLAEEKMIVEVG